MEKKPPVGDVCFCLCAGTDPNDPEVQRGMSNLMKHLEKINAKRKGKF